MTKKSLSALAIAVFGASALSAPLQAQSMTLEPLGAEESYRANGNEPFWHVTIQGRDIAFEHLGVVEATGSYDHPVRTSGVTAYIAADESDGAAGSPLIVLVEDRPCADSMAGTPHPHTVRAIVASSLYSGCGGDPVDMLAGEPWTITHLMETPFTGDRAITMAFDRAGGVSGTTGCNRYSASYEMGEGLSFGPIRSTRMACPGPIGENEQRIFTAIRSVISVDYEQNGNLVLYSEHGPVLRLAR